ncbi:LysR family transcriptional regulator [Nocardia sp. A7]|uniref:LysR family transcriptional regulator n=1 Tax=Nocardia sp. A7 TaxID=2789274 RepID=UPI0039783B81
MNLEIRDLEYAVTLSEELNFTRAAARLGIAQPPLSRAIARLERRLGAALFARTSRSVALTAAGAEFVADARTILAELQALIDRTGAAARRRELVIAVRPATGSGLLHDILERAARQPDPLPLRVILERDPGGAVLSGAADVALLCLSQAPASMAVDELVEQPTVILLPENHPLASHSALCVEEVGQLPGHMADCPPIPLDEIVDLIRLEGRSILASRDVTTRIGDHVVAVTVPDAPTIGFGLAYPTTATHPRLSELVHQARRVAYTYTEASNLPPTLQPGSVIEASVNQTERESISPL